MRRSTDHDSVRQKRAAASCLGGNGSYGRRLRDNATGGRETEEHPAPRRQLVVVVDGEFEIATTDGETRTFTPGTVLLIEDTTGRGHVTTVRSPGPATFMAIPLGH